MHSKVALGYTHNDTNEKISTPMIAKQLQTNCQVTDMQV